MPDDLDSFALTLVAGKGILAADETVPTLTKRFDALGSQSGRNQPTARTQATEDHLVIRARAPESRAGEVGRQGREPRSWPAGPLSPRPLHGAASLGNHTDQMETNGVGFGILSHRHGWRSDRGSD
jgi:hypothetical protein